MIASAADADIASVAIADGAPINLVDIQVNGGFGVDFSSAAVTLSDLRDCCIAILDTGVTAFLPTIISSDPEVYRRNIPLLVGLMREDAMQGRLLGIHLEGPFISDQAGYVGAHRQRNVTAAKQAQLSEYIDLASGCIRVITIGAEVDGAYELVRQATARAIKVMIGHSNYDSANLLSMNEAGAVGLTHIGNALPEHLNKRRNPWMTGLLADSYVASFIPDGHHLSKQMLELLFKCKGSTRLIAISDASPVAGLPPGDYEVFGQTAVVRSDGAVLNEEEGHLVGSSIHLLDAVNQLLSFDVCTVEEAVRVSCDNPLRFLGLKLNDLADHFPRARFDIESRQFRL